MCLILRVSLILASIFLCTQVALSKAPCAESSNDFDAQIENLKNIVEKLENNNIASFGRDEFPWLGTLVYSQEGKPSGRSCTATLVSEKILLTARHCVDGKNKPTSFCYQDYKMRCKKQPKIKKLILDEKLEGDFAFIELVEPIPLPKYPKIMWQGEDLVEKDIYLAGYPVSKMNDGGFWPLLSHCSVTKYSEGREMRSDCYSKKGGSGGPALIYDNAEFSIVGLTSKVYLPLAKIIGLKGTLLVPSVRFQSKWDEIFKDQSN